jgi:hypothetical protein
LLGQVDHRLVEQPMMKKKIMNLQPAPGWGADPDDCLQAHSHNYDKLCLILTLIPENSSGINTKFRAFLKSI